MNIWEWQTYASMTTLQYFEAYTVLSYLIGIAWFLLIERKAGMIFWRALSTAISPIAVPILALVGICLPLLEWLLGKNKKTKTTPTE